MNRREFVQLGIVAGPLTAAIHRTRADVEQETGVAINQDEADSIDDLEAARRIVANHDIPNDIHPRFFPSLP